MDLTLLQVNNHAVGSKFGGIVVLCKKILAIDQVHLDDSNTFIFITLALNKVKNIIVIAAYEP